MAIEKTLVLLKPCTLQRALVGEIISIFEKKGLHICGMKMMQLTDELLSEHYAHLSSKPFFQRVKDSMMTAPVVAMCLAGVDAIAAVRALAGPTNGRNAAPGTIRGSYCMSFQENIVHASDSPETAAVELKRFFKDEEILYDLDEVMDSVGIQLLGVVPEDNNIKVCGAKGMPLPPSCPGAKAYAAIAKRILGEDIPLTININ